MSLTATPVSASGNGYYFALANDPGLGQTLSLSSNTISISGGNSVNIANATLVSTSATKLTAQSFIAGFNTTNFTGDVRSEGSVISAPPLGLGTATLNGSLANVTITGIGGNNPSVLFEKGVDSASIVYNGAGVVGVEANTLPTLSLNEISTATTVSIANNGGVLALQPSTTHTGVGNQVRILSDKTAIEVSKYLKVLIGGIPYWLPLLAENPVGGFKSPAYIPFTVSQPVAGTIRFEWAAVPGAVSYKIFIREDNQPYVIKNDTNPVNKYGVAWYNSEDATTNLFYELALSSTIKYNFLVFAYDALGIRSEMPATQFYARLQLDNTIEWAVSPLFIYSFGNGVSNYGEWINSSASPVVGGDGLGTLTVWNNSAQLSYTVTFDSIVIPLEPLEAVFPQVPQLLPDPIISGIL